MTTNWDRFRYRLLFGRPAVWKLPAVTRALSHAARFQLPFADVLRSRRREEGRLIDLRDGLSTFVYWHRLAGLPGVLARAGWRRRLERELWTRFEDDLGAGRRLADVLDDHPQVFPEGYRTLIRAGETAGSLPESLRVAEEWARREAETREFLRTRGIYPLSVLAVAAMIVFIVDWKVLPTFASLAAATRHALPLPTRLLMRSGALFGDVLFPLLLLWIALSWGFLLLYRSSTVSRLLGDRLRLLLGAAWTPGAARESGIVFETASLLLRGGVPLHEALALSAAGFSSSVTRAQFLGAFGDVAGGGLSRNIAAIGPLDAASAAALSVALRTGRLPDAFALLSRRALFIARRRHRRVERLAAPVATAAVGLFVAWVVLATYGPIFEVSGWIP